MNRRLNRSIKASIYSLAIVAFVCIGYAGLSSTGVLSDGSSEDRIGLDRIDGISTAITATLINPVVMKVDRDYVYVGDWGDFVVKKFDKQGHLVSRIGRGRGSGPGEFNQIGAFDIYRDTVWVVDLRDRSVLTFDGEGTYLDEFHIDHPANRIEVTNQYIVLLGLGGEIFHAYDRAGNPIKTFGRLISDQAVNPISTDGTLESSESGTQIIYHPLYASYIYTIDSLAISRTVEGIDGQPYPASNPESESGQFVVRAPSTPIEYDDISISNDILYVLKNYYDDSGEQSVSYLHQYEYGSFRHVGTIEIPKRVSYAEVRNDTLYTLADTTFLAYKMEDDAKGADD